MIRALLVTHGRVGEALVEAVEGFLGPQDGVNVISNAGLSADAIRERVEGAIEALGPGDDLVLFTDLAGGSCETACRLLASQHTRCQSVAGVNLPMLLEFCHYRARLEAGALVERVIMKGRRGIHDARTESG